MAELLIVSGSCDSRSLALGSSDHSTIRAEQVPGISKLAFEFGLATNGRSQSRSTAVECIRLPTPYGCHPRRRSKRVPTPRMQRHHGFDHVRGDSMTSRKVLTATRRSLLRGAASGALGVAAVGWIENQ